MIKIFPLPQNQQGLVSLLEKEAPGFVDQECLSCKKPSNGTGVFIMSCVCGCRKHINAVLFSLCNDCNNKETQAQIAPQIQAEDQKHRRENSEELS